MYDLTKARHTAVANHSSYLSERFNFEGGLDFNIRIAVRRLSNAEAVVCKSVVAAREGIIDIRVVEPLE